MDPLTMGLIAAGATAAKAGLQAIPTKFEREQKKRLAELQRKQELGLLGLTEAERAQIESQLRAPREQAQRRSDAEIARLSTPTAQSGQQLLAAQLGAEGRQRMEADLASQLLGMDIQRQREQEADIAAMEAGQGLKQDEMRASLAAIPMAGAEAYIGQMGLEQLINVSKMTPQQRNTYLKNDLQLDDTETSLLQLDEVVDPRIVPIAQQVDGLFPQGGTMPQLQSSQRQVDGLYPQQQDIVNTMILDPRAVSAYDRLPEHAINMVETVFNDLMKQGKPKTRMQIIQLFDRYNVTQSDLQEAYRIMNMLNERGNLNVTIAEAIAIYKNSPEGNPANRLFNQSMNIPSDQVSMINQTAYPALEGRINVTDTRGREI